jgi:integrase
MVKVLLEALEEYKALRGSEANNIRSHIKKRVLPELLTASEIERWQHKPLDVVLEQIPVAGFVVLASPIFERNRLQVENDNTRKVMKSQWKRFCNWLQAQDWYVAEPIARALVVEESVTFTHLPKAASQLKQSKQRTHGNYRLKESEVNPVLREQLQAFDQFCQTISQHRSASNRNITQAEYRQFIYAFLGWRKNIQQIESKDLDLAQFTDPTLLKAYVQWNRDRGMSSNTIEAYVRPVPLVAQFLFIRSSPDASSAEVEQTLKPLRDFRKGIVDQKDRPHASDEACQARSLTPAQCETIVEYLQWRCKDLEKEHGVTNQVVDAWMDYLIIALLVTTGVRQREIRELCPKRLVLEADGTYSVSLQPDDHKTGSKTHKGRGYPLFVGPMRKQLCADLTYYLESIRPQNLDHSYLFFSRKSTTSNGERRYRGTYISHAGVLSQLVPDLISQVAGHLFGDAKRTTCHDFRRITATWVSTYGEPKHFAMYAEMLGHSEQMLKNLYAKVHPGALAAQVPFGREEITANEARVQGKTVQSAVSEMEAKLAELEEFRTMSHQMWGALSKTKRKEFQETWTPKQCQLMRIVS